MPLLQLIGCSESIHQQCLTTFTVVVQAVENLESCSFSEIGVIIVCSQGQVCISSVTVHQLVTELPHATKHSMLNVCYLLHNFLCVFHCCRHIFYNSNTKIRNRLDNIINTSVCVHILTHVHYCNIL